MGFNLVGKLISTHGLKGEIKTKSFSDFDRFYEGSVLYVKIDSDYVKVIVDSARPFGNDFYLVAFKDYLDIDLAKPLTGKDILIDDLEREELGENEFYYSDLLGLTVVNQNNETKGIVKEVREVPQGHMLVVKGERQALVPFRKEFIIKVDKETKQIVVNEIEGLFWELQFWLYFQTCLLDF